MGAVEAILESIGVWMAAGDQQDYERDSAFVRSLLDEETFQKHWNEGRALSLEQALAIVDVEIPA